MKKIGKLEAMMAALEEVNDRVIRDNEFTAADFLDMAKQNGKHISRRAARERLVRLTNEGKLKMRKLLINDRITNVYSAP